VYAKIYFFTLYYRIQQSKPTAPVTNVTPVQPQQQ